MDDLASVFRYYAGLPIRTRRNAVSSGQTCESKVVREPVHDHSLVLPALAGGLEMGTCACSRLYEDFETERDPFEHLEVGGIDGKGRDSRGVNIVTVWETV